MRESDLTEFLTFLSIVEQGSLARAGARLGVTGSSISQTLRRLEDRLGAQLLQRTTRSVQLTQAGANLADELRVAFDQMERAASAASASGETVTGTVRLTLSAVAAELVIHPRLAELRRLHPGLMLELSVDEQLVDIGGERFDAGLRRGDLVKPGMRSHAVSPAIRMLAVASPGYLGTVGAIEQPRQLRQHNCIRVRSITNGVVPPWHFTDGTSPIDIKVSGTVAADTTTLALAAALNGTGIAYLGSDYLAPYLRSGQLVAVLEDYAVTRPGFHLYHPGRHQVPPPLQALIQFLKPRAG